MAQYGHRCFFVEGERGFALLNPECGRLIPRRGSLRFTAPIGTGYENDLFASSGAAASSLRCGRSPSWEFDSSIGPGLATVELFMSVGVVVASSPPAEPIVFGTFEGLACKCLLSTCISSVGLWMDFATAAIGSLSGFAAADSSWREGF